jgi:hypothetical protein
MSREVDEKSFALAEYFLSNLEGDEASEDQKWQLAKVIQDAIEDWFEHGAVYETPLSIPSSAVVKILGPIRMHDSDLRSESSEAGKPT